ncbi:MAG: hypothetical protein WA110_00625 [Anaerolineaceae bacterium]
MAEWLELLEMQIGDYASQPIAWEQIARDKIFPFLNDRLAAMQEAQQNIMATFGTICNQAFERLGFDSDVVCIIYVGIGCGAGWVTTYEGIPAVLFGLENIAECRWSAEHLITGLTAHELGHVVHATWRAQAHKPDGEGPWWQLFTEGFAQRCEHLILQKETWHEAGNADKNWISWCSDHKEHLASEFLRLVSEKKDVRPFFGSWYEIDGHSQCGYFLGHEVIKDLQLKGMSLSKIGTLDHPEGYLREALEYYAKAPLP